MYIIQLMNYAAAYRGNFFRSLEALENGGEVTNLYLFCPEAKKEKTQAWISELKDRDRIFYLTGIQKEDTALIKKLICKYSPTAIHVHFGSTEQFNAAIAAAGRKVTVIRHFHNHSNYGGRSVKNYLRRFVFRKVVMIGCSDSVADSVRSDFQKNKVYSVVNAIDFSRLDAAIGETKEITTDVTDLTGENINDHKAVNLLMLGFDFQRKGVDLAVKAVKSINTEVSGGIADKGLKNTFAEDKAASKIILNIVMASNLEDNSRKICDLLETGSLPDWINILEPTDNIAEYFRDNDIFISASREEGFCYAIPEAAYSGCKVIASDTPGQLVHKQIPGIAWFKSGEEASLEIAIKETLEINRSDNRNGDSNKNLSLEDFQAFLRQTYDLDRWAEEIKEIYRQM